MSGDGNKTQSTTNTSMQLPEATMGALNTSTTAAQNLFNSGSLFQPFMGSTVVPHSPETRRGMEAAAFRADGWGGWLDRAFENNVNMATSADGLSADQRSAMDMMRAIAGNANGSSSQSNLGAYANGSMIGRGNPAFDAVLQRSQQDATNAVNLGASAAGRYGSGVHQGNVAREVGDLTNRALSSQYNQDIANMFSANNAMDTQRLANLGIQSQAAGSLFNAGQAGYQNRLSALGQLGNSYQNAMLPSQTLMQVGAMNEDDAARRMNDDLRRFNEGNSQQRQAIEWLNAIATGAGNLGATQTQTVQAPKANPFMSALGGATSGFGMAGPAGALLGGGAGLLGSFF